MKIFLVEVTNWEMDVPVWIDSVWTSPMKAEKRAGELRLMTFGETMNRASVEMMKVEK